MGFAENVLLKLSTSHNKHLLEIPNFQINKLYARSSTKKECKMEFLESNLGLSKNPSHSNDRNILKPIYSFHCEFISGRENAY